MWWPWQDLYWDEGGRLRDDVRSRDSTLITTLSFYSIMMAVQRISLTVSRHSLKFPKLLFSCSCPRLAVFPDLLSSVFCQQTEDSLWKLELQSFWGLILGTSGISTLCGFKVLAQVVHSCFLQ